MIWSTQGARNSQDKWQSQHMFLWSYKDLWLRYFTLFLPRIFCFLSCLVVGLILRNLTKVKFLKLSQGKLVRLKVGIRFSAIFRPFWAEVTNKKMLTFWWCQHNFSCFLIFSNKQGKEESGHLLYPRSHHIHFPQLSCRSNSPLILYLLCLSVHYCNVVPNPSVWHQHLTNPWFPWIHW